MRAYALAGKGRRRPQHLEEDEQIAFVDWTATQRVAIDDGERVLLCDLVFAVPNGAHLAGSAQLRAFKMHRLKRMGLKPGVSDLVLMVPRGRWHGLFIEFKKQRKDFRSPSDIARAVSDDQRAFGALSERCGYRHIVCYGFEDAKRKTLAYVEERDIVLQEAHP